MRKLTLGQGIVSHIAYINIMTSSNNIMKNDQVKELISLLSKHSKVCLFFFLFFFKGDDGWERFFWFFVVLNVFPQNSQVPNVFPNIFPIVLHFFPNSLLKVLLLKTYTFIFNPNEKTTTYLFWDYPKLNFSM